MVSKLFAALILFFQPEDSCSLANEKYFQQPVFRSVKKRSNISAKALFWILISILIGLAIGQRC